MRLMALLIAAMAFSCQADAQPPYDLEVVVGAPGDGGEVTGYVLYVDNVEIGPVVVGSNPYVLEANGSPVFEVEARGPFGATRSDPFVLVVLPPGKPTINILVVNP